MITGLGSARDLASRKRGAFYNTLEEFHKYWDRIDIICPKLVSLQACKLTSLLGNVYVHISPWPLIFHPFWFIKKAIEIYKEHKFDLMTVHEFPPFYNGIAAKILHKITQVPYVLEILHIPGHPKAASIKEFVYKILFKSFIYFDASSAKSVRVINKNQVPDFLIKSGVPKNKITYLPAIYIDTEIFKPMDVVKEYDLIFVGRLEKNKGIDLFLEAVRTLRIKNEKLKVLIVGRGSLSKKIKLEIRNSKLEIIMYGWAKDSQEIAGLINKSKVLVMTSYNEGGPRVIFEAMACGVPVIATPVGMVPDFSSAITVIDWNPEDIADKAKKLLFDQQMYEEMKLKGLSVVSQFEKKQVIKHYAETLQKLANSSV